MTELSCCVIIPFAVKQKTLQGGQIYGKRLIYLHTSDFYSPFLSEKQRNLLHHYYNEDLSLSEIAENEAITRQGVRDLIKRGEMQLKHYEQECGWCENVLSLQKILDSDAPPQEQLAAIKEIVNKF